MIGRPSLLLLTAATAALSTMAQGLSAASPAESDAADTRLGTEIARELQGRDEAAAQRNRALDMREKAMRATEQRIKADLANRQEQAAAARARPAAKAPNPGEQYDELARIYQAMKPAKAALVFEQLDLDVQMKVAQRMRERATAMMLANMTPKGAATLSMALARRQLPTRAARSVDVSS